MVCHLLRQELCACRLLRKVFFLSIMVLLLDFAATASLRAQSGAQPQNYTKQIEPPQTDNLEEMPPDIEIAPIQDETEEQPAAENPATPVMVDAGSAEAQKSAEKIFIRQMVVADGDEQTQATVARIVAPYLNRQLTMKEISEAAAKVTRYYKKHGYLVAKTIVPKQDAGQGVLTLNLILGAYGDFIVKNHSKLRDSVVKGAFESMKNSSPDIRSQSLERTMLLLREMPGGAMPSVALQPGKAPGTADMQINIENSANRYQGYLLGDNEGSRYTGRKRLYGALNINSPLGIGDRISLTGMMSEGRDLHNLRFGYSLPLLSNGLRFEIAASRTRYALNGGEYSTLDASGSASSIEGTFSYPIFRRRDSDFDLSLNIAHRDLHDNLNAVDILNPRTADVGSGTLQRTKFSTLLGHRFYTSTGATITVGEINEENATEAASTGTDGDYEKIDVNLMGETSIFRGLSVRATGVMQKDLRVKPLDNSEELFISGSGGVRAFSEGMGGDNGYIFNLELPYTLPNLGHARLQHSLSAFFDSGGLRAEKNGDSSTDFVLNDAGGGYSATYYPLFFKVQGVRILGSIHNETDKTRAWFQLGFIF